MTSKTSRIAHQLLQGEKRATRACARGVFATTRQAGSHQNVDDPTALNAKASNTVRSTAKRMSTEYLTRRRVHSSKL
jgi:hypothetical protein